MIVIVTRASTANSPDVIRYRATYEAQQDKTPVPIYCTYLNEKAYHPTNTPHPRPVMYTVIFKVHASLKRS